ncbi:MAG: helix-turn-helix domain-containing protein [Lachnospiraceae bacterium]|nr:helix-turn-helix domain-containing protein [Lachnospiraceae bacterium]
MILTYEKRNTEIALEQKKTIHVPPHLHEEIEMIFVTEGSVELGVGQELFHLEKGDFGIVFPNVIHHYQVFGSGRNRAIYLFARPTLFSSYIEELQNCCPKIPVITKEDVSPDIEYVINQLVKQKEYNGRLAKAYMQIILAHVFMDMEIINKDSVGTDDIIYKAVEYVAKNFREEITLEKMAFDLCVSKYVLSRMFAKTFHCNFSKYVNGIRLSYAQAILQDSKESITNIALDCGFESQRTFNRVFKEQYKMTPREFRSKAMVSNANEHTNDGCSA